MTPEERAKKYLAECGDEEDHPTGVEFWMPERCDEGAVEWLVPLIRQAENDALERAAEVADGYQEIDIWDNVASATSRVADRIRALKHPEPI